MTSPFGYRGPDGDILLEEALGPHLLHYVGIMVSGAADRFVTLPSEPDGDVPSGTVIRLGCGCPTRASACGEVAVQPSFVWDVCGYYLRLGVHWTATKKDLRRAFLELDPRRENEQLCYCLAQLLDDVIRSAYDRMPLGGMFLWDRDVMAVIKRAAAREAGRRMSQGGQASADEVMGEMGFRQIPRDEAYEETRRARPQAPQGTAEPPASRWAQQWGHYFLAGPQGIPRLDAARLESWQGLVAAALRKRGIMAEFAVAQGFADSPLVLRNINEPCIFVLTEESASPEKATEAVEMGIRLGIVTDNSLGGIMPVIEEGLDAAKAASEAQSSAFHRVSTLRIKDGETVYLRFISEKTATFAVHGGIPTKAKPAEIKGDNWPKLMWAICQNDKPFRLRDAAGNVLDAYEEGMGDCHIHLVMKGRKDPKFGNEMSVPRVQTFGLAVLREPVHDTDTKGIIGFKDQTEEFKDAEGTVHTIPKVVIIQQTFSNFWAPISASSFLGPRTLCDKDFVVTRKDKDYTIGGGVSDPELAPGKPKWKRYEDALALLGFELIPQLLEWASPDWYKRWFIEGAVPEGGYGRQGDDSESAESAGAATAAGTDQPTQELVDAWREKLKAGRSQPAAAAAE
jgi:hypothetical protein